MTRLLLVLSTFVFTTFYATTSAQSYALNDSRMSSLPPTATVTAANFTVNSRVTIFNSTHSSFNASDADKDTGNEDNEEDEDRSREFKERDEGDTDSDDDSDSSSESDDDSDSSSDSDDDSDSSKEKGRPTFSNVFNATSTIRSTYRNWIGTALGKATKTACYRKTHIAKTCPLGYHAKWGTCWAECPYAYPVKCGMECIRQNDDCLLEVITKVATVAQAAFSIAPENVYGQFKSMAKGIQIAFKCSKEMMGLVKSLNKYIRIVKVTDPHVTQEQLLTILYQTDNVIFDIPVTVAACLGIPVDENFKFSDRLVNTAELILHDVTSNSATIISDWSAFTSFMKHINFGKTISKLKKSDISSLKTALLSESTCGYDMKRLLDRTWMTVAEMRRQDPSISEDDIRVAMSKSNLALHDIPTVTNNCMAELIAESNEAEAYSVRDTLRKGMGNIMEDLIQSGTSNNGTYLTAREYAFEIADKIATFYAVWEKKNIGGVMSEFFQTLCGPTEFIGEIDDGSAEDALGLKTVEKAFKNSTGSWTKKGDGSVVITFKSMDTKDVSVNIYSGGEKVDEVDVPAGKTMTWRSTVKALEGRTLYLDRWRPGFLHIPKLGGGSLLLWVPRATEGGNLQLTVLLNVS
ncbi:unnamed protein product [Peronospora belbahrii]|uniref:Uncharacterized protein n=1 Tax=Peronospora belbahrii TaxID=622444 RepID=A0ABN8D917_9STRA|nr:unnamed protein product [Peronospora belbahrii]